MLKSITASPHANILEQALSAASFRHKVISNNIANVNTPGFKKSEVTFEQQLEQALGGNNLKIAKTHDRHFGFQATTGVKPAAQTLSNYSLRTDGNNVDIDIEMAELAKNSIYYDAIAQQLSRYFSSIKSAINEGRR